MHESEMTFGAKLKTLEKLAELGGEDQVIEQTVAKLLHYATARHRQDLADITAKLHFLEEQFAMDSDLFSQKFHSGELGDEEEFLRWDALLVMQQHIAQRLAILLAGSPP
jgi:hypothetical protein